MIIVKNMLNIYRIYGTRLQPHPPVMVMVPRLPCGNGRSIPSPPVGMEVSLVCMYVCVCVYVCMYVGIM